MKQLVVELLIRVMVISAIGIASAYAGLKVGDFVAHNGDVQTVERR